MANGTTSTVVSPVEAFLEPGATHSLANRQPCAAKSTFMATLDSLRRGRSRNCDGHAVGELVPGTSSQLRT